MRRTRTRDAAWRTPICSTTSNSAGLFVTHHRRRYPAAVAVADGRVRREDPLGQQELHALAVVADRPLPVLGRLAPGDVLELVRGDPRVLLFAIVETQLSSHHLQSNLEEIYRNMNAFLCQLFRKFLWQTSLEPDARSF